MVVSQATSSESISKATNASNSKSTSKKKEYSEDFMSYMAATTSNNTLADNSQKDSSKVSSKITDNYDSRDKVVKDEPIKTDKAPTNEVDRSDDTRVEDRQEDTDINNQKIDTNKRDNLKTDTKENASTNQEDIADETSEIVDTSMEITNNQIISMDTLQGILDTLTQNILTTLNVSEEDLKSMLSDMGLEMQDLLDVNNLKDLVLKFNNAEPVDIVTNENLANMIKSVTDTLEQVKEEFQLSDDDISMILKSNIPSLNVEDGESINVNKNSSDQGVDGIKSADEGVKVTVINERTSDTSDSTKNDTREGFKGETQAGDKNVANQIVNNLGEAVSKVDNFVQKMTDEVKAQEIVRQVVDQIRVTIKQDTTNMELQLYPEHLGKVQIHVMSREGVVTAQIIVENELAKVAIENSINTLKETFNNQELKVEAVEVSVATAGFNQQQKDNSDGNQEDTKSKTNRNIDLDSISDLGNLTSEEELEVAMMEAQGRSVNYQV